ncbi:elongator complex protein 5 [Gouania willdenowi]|uniref:Elongator complex protein 5 n=1 Tax=Gouania willdenowi TaxID=441366 RepID=A0A8C5GQX9_GOUWI|nr:elongator complex protein 5 [Gouania willdenowi]
MLSELLQGNNTGDFLLLADSCSCSARNLLKSVVVSALNREESVHVLGFETSEEELNQTLNSSLTQRLHFHNAYSDPLGWTDHSAFTVDQFTSEQITHLIKRTVHSKPPLLVIDSLSWILRHASPLAVCRTLQQLKKGGAVRAVVGLLHADMHQRGTVGSVRHLASSVVSISPALKGDEAVAKITKRSKSGKVTQDEVTFSINGDLTLTIHSKQNPPSLKPTEPEEQQTDPTAHLTFNLRLSDAERQAKEKLSLPFVFSKEKKTALLHSTQGSGRILYEPDANDDFDQEDPDDDLDV